MPKQITAEVRPARMPDNTKIRTKQTKKQVFNQIKL